MSYEIQITVPKGAALTVRHSETGVHLIFADASDSSGKVKADEVAAPAPVAALPAPEVTDPVGDFLKLHTRHEVTGRLRTMDFARAYGEWALENAAPIYPHTHLAAILRGRGIQKVKSHGNQTFAGLAWNHSPALEQLLTSPVSAA